MNSLPIDSHTHISPTHGSRTDAPKFLVLHYTAQNFKNSIRYLTTTVSAHYLIPLQTDPTYPFEDMRIFNLVSEEKKAFHAGVSHWKKFESLNNTSIGIEIVNLAPGFTYPQSPTTGLPQFPEEQIQLIISLCKDILKRHPSIVPTNVIGHSDIAYTRKGDPGPLFPWKKLHKEGIGAWYDEKKKLDYEEQFQKKLPSPNEVFTLLEAYGYQKPNSKEKENLLWAFQLHFRPSLYNGKLDAETAAIAFALEI